MITGHNKIGENTSGQVGESSVGELTETIVIDAPDDVTADLRQYTENDGDKNGNVQKGIYCCP